MRDLMPIQLRRFGQIRETDREDRAKRIAAAVAAIPDLPKVIIQQEAK